MFNPGVEFGMLLFARRGVYGLEVQDPGFKFQGRRFWGASVLAMWGLGCRVYRILMEGMVLVRILGVCVMGW